MSTSTRRAPDAVQGRDEMVAAIPAVGHLIDGRIVFSNNGFPVIAPWCEEEIGRCPDADANLVSEAVRAAQRTQKAWAADEPGRRDALRSMAEILETHQDELATILAAETGKPMHIARGEIMGSIQHLSWYAAREIPTQVLTDNDVEKIVVVRDPIGVVAAITPWNAPLMMMANKIGAAFLTGNTVVVKPSPFTPLASLRFAELAKDAIPAGVLNVLGGGDETGRQLTVHQGVGLISLTGSIDAGKAVMAQSSAGLKRLQLELGGNDAAIVLPDVDVAAIAQQIYRGAFALSGQICAAIKRLYVHEDVHDELVKALIDIANSARPGDPFEVGVTMGPSTTKPQYERVLSLIEDARNHGGIIHCGGEVPNRSGYFIAPTIVTGVAEGVALVDEEQFGPVLPVLKFRDLDEAIDRANATDYGLGSSVWTADSDRGVAVARRLRAGGAWVNRHPHVGVEIPFGGIKLSGLGREGADAGIDAFSELKTISILK